MRNSAWFGCNNLSTTKLWASSTGAVQHSTSNYLGELGARIEQNILQNSLTMHHAKARMNLCKKRPFRACSPIPVIVPASCGWVWEPMWCRRNLNQALIMNHQAQSSGNLLVCELISIWRGWVALDNLSLWPMCVGCLSAWPFHSRLLKKTGCIWEALPSSSVWWRDKH